MKNINAIEIDEKEMMNVDGGLVSAGFVTPIELYPDRPGCVWNENLNDPEYIASIKIHMQDRDPELRCWIK